MKNLLILLLIVFTFFGCMVRTAYLICRENVTDCFHQEHPFGKLLLVDSSRKDMSVYIINYIETNELQK
jgi:hypothetical protein